MMVRFMILKVGFFPSTDEKGYIIHMFSVISDKSP